MCYLLNISLELSQFSFPNCCSPSIPTSFNQRAYRWLRTMVFAVEEINSDPHLLPNLTLGYLAADTCLAESTTLSTALTMVTGLQVSRAGDGCQSAPAVPVIIGDARSSSSMVIADTLGVFDVPMVRTMY